MAAEWAYAFYHSTAWKVCRAAYAASVHYLCERCGKPGKIVHHNKVWLTPSNINDPHITLGWWNLQMVCDDCHKEAHRKKPSAMREGFAFDEDGNLVRSE